MKSQNHFFTIIFTLILTSMLIMGCQQDPVSSVNNEPTELLSSSKEIKVITYDNGPKSLKKIVTVSEWVTWKEGGELKLKATGTSNTTLKSPQVNVTLKIQQYTISQDAELALSMDDAELSGNFDMLFSPHGITFSSPAILNIEAKHLDLSGIDGDDINIYYDNEETGTWEIMECKEIIVKEDEGYVKIVDAELPHFSRYAIGME